MRCEAHLGGWMASFYIHGLAFWSQNYYTDFFFPTVSISADFFTETLRMWKKKYMVCLYSLTLSCFSMYYIG